VAAHPLSCRGASTWSGSQAGGCGHGVCLSSDWQRITAVPVLNPAGARKQTKI